jgi:thiosulfate dehydrogenase [quinone] large subunit
MATTTSDNDVSTATETKIGWTFLSLTRIAIGFVFLWAFLDKLLALGYSTGRDKETGAVDFLGEKAWVNGNHVTEGYLGSSSGPLGDFFAGLGEQRWTDWAFMIGLAGIGLALMLGIGTKIGAWSGMAMLMMMYVTHAWPGAVDPGTNPFLDDHIIYSLAGVGIVYVELKYQAIGLGRWWRKLDIVKKNGWLV